MTKLTERRYCKRKGCRGWWVVRSKRVNPRLYCKNCHRSYARWIDQVASRDALRKP